KKDNHGDQGGNFVFTDGHAEFLKGNIQYTFFSRVDDDDPDGDGDGRTNPQSINTVDSDRSNRVQTLD
ncbi:MAG: hypothetical protein KDA28_15105, partial [Phycisphaerales bacterium]|nr:hypothetical protein [Phycisphaerales bacterium]